MIEVQGEIFPVDTVWVRNADGELIELKVPDDTEEDAEDEND